MVNPHTDADLSAAVQNALQALLLQIHVEIREEFCTSSGPIFFDLLVFSEQLLVPGRSRQRTFSGGFCRSTLNHLMCMSYTDVAQVANASHNYEILHERDDDDIKRPDKW
uniref:Uncharacterized protein n=1 Tax=Tanacetum cinerariifolium TaxID=118510 RepID=A0A699R4Y2_TANCI|nr:hypothetical protein [Tanacetum cinerariifolium]